MDANWETYLREAGLRIDSHMRFQDEKIAGLEALVDQLQDEVWNLKNPPAAFMWDDPLNTVPQEGVKA